MGNVNLMSLETAHLVTIDLGLKLGRVGKKSSAGVPIVLTLAVEVNLYCSKNLELILDSHSSSFYFQLIRRDKLNGSSNLILPNVSN